MNYWLVKADPDSDYSLDDLQKDGSTLWDGVHNFQAINFIKQWETGDKIYFYHSQQEKSIVGLAEVASQPSENKADVRTSWAAWIKFIEKFDTPITLAQIKAEPNNSDFLLVRNGRLSVMPVPEKVQKWIESRL
jgi:predicted RNA-binding protein with PUA-like domain